MSSPKVNNPSLSTPTQQNAGKATTTAYNINGAQTATLQPKPQQVMQRSKQILWATLGGLIVIIIAVLAVIFLPKIFHQPKLTDLTTNADGDEISLATARAEEILAGDTLNLEQVEEFYNSEIDKEPDFAQKTALIP